MPNWALAFLRRKSKRVEKSNFDKISFNQDVKVIRTYQIQQLQLFQCHLHRCSLLNYPWMLNDIWIDAVCNCYFYPRVYESLTGHESFFCNTLGIDSIILVTCKLITFILWWIISYLFNWISNCWCSLFISSSSTVWYVERGSDQKIFKWWFSLHRTRDNLPYVSGVLKSIPDHITNNNYFLLKHRFLEQLDYQESK